MFRVQLAPTARAQIATVLLFTLGRYGQRKYDEYDRLVDAAIKALAANPQVGKRRPEIHPDAWTLHIARGTKRARHLFVYRIRADVEIARFLYDAMDLRRQRPEEWDEP